MKDFPLLATKSAVSFTTSRSWAFIMGILAEKWNAGGSTGPLGFSGSGAAAASPGRPADIAVPLPSLISVSRHR